MPNFRDNERRRTQHADPPLTARTQATARAGPDSEHAASRSLLVIHVGSQMAFRRIR